MLLVLSFFLDVASHPPAFWVSLEQSVYSQCTLNIAYRILLLDGCLVLLRNFPRNLIVLKHLNVHVMMWLVQWLQGILFYRYDMTVIAFLSCPLDRIYLGYVSASQKRVHLTSDSCVQLNICNLRVSFQKRLLCLALNEQKPFTVIKVGSTKDRGVVQPV